MNPKSLRRLAMPCGAMWWSRSCHAVSIKNTADFWSISTNDGDRRAARQDSRARQPQHRLRSRFWNAPCPAPGCGQLVRHGCAFLQHALWDSVHGGFFAQVDRSGRPRWEGIKHPHAVTYAALAFLLAEPYCRLARAGCGRAGAGNGWTMWPGIRFMAGTGDPFAGTMIAIRRVRICLRLVGATYLATAGLQRKQHSG